MSLFCVGGDAVTLAPRSDVEALCFVVEQGCKQC